MTSDEEKEVTNQHTFDRPLNMQESVRTNPTGPRYTVTGDYLYYHYGQDATDDNGWGCAYRSM